MKLWLQYLGISCYYFFITDTIPYIIFTTHIKSIKGCYAFELFVEYFFFITIPFSDDLYALYTFITFPLVPFGSFNHYRDRFSTLLYYTRLAKYIIISIEYQIPHQPPTTDIIKSPSNIFITHTQDNVVR